MLVSYEINVHVSKSLELKNFSWNHEKVKKVSVLGPRKPAYKRAFIVKGRENRTTYQEKGECSSNQRRIQRGARAPVRF